MGRVVPGSLRALWEDFDGVARHVRDQEVKAAVYEGFYAGAAAVLFNLRLFADGRDKAGALRFMATAEREIMEHIAEIQQHLRVN